MTNRLLMKLKESIEEEICDRNLRKYIIEYFEFVIFEESLYKLSDQLIWKFRKLITYFKNVNIEELSWEHLCDLINLSNDDTFVGVHHIRKIYCYFYHKGIVKDQHTEYLKNHPEILEMELRGTRITELFQNFIPENFYYKINGKSIIYLNLNVSNNLIRELLREFLNSFKYSDFNSTRIKSFIKYFEASLNSFNQINDISDFSYNTFRLQYRFYMKLEKRIGKELRMQLNLVKFYMFLHKYINEHNFPHQIFIASDRINYNLLCRNDFKHMYDNGFRVHYYNAFDTEENQLMDRLLISPNGYENYSTAIREDDLITIDFSIVKNHPLRDLLKQFFKEDMSKSLITVHRKIYAVMQFLNFIGEIYGNPKIININKNDVGKGTLEITPNLVSMFRVFVIKKYNNNTSRNKMLQSVKDFLLFINNKTLVKVYYECFDLLQLLSKEEGRIKPIPQSEIKEIVNFFKKRKSNGGLKEKLEWTILYVCLTTNIRINELLNLEVNNMNFENKIIMLARKGYGRKLQEYYASDYLLEILKETINITSQYRDRANENVKKYIFLYERNDKEIAVMNRDNFYRHFKQIVNSIEIIEDDYVVYDLRDTFMTNLFEQGKKEGKNFFDLHSATGHKQFSTSVKHYRESDIKNYLEAFFKIRIGFNDVKGKVVENIQDELGSEVNIEQRKVKGQSGYCRFNECVDEDDIDCLTCNHFITTLDHLPIIKKTIFEIDLEIENEPNYNEKQALIKVKELYVRYMLEMLNLAQID
jgi:site-specific recombinase XerD